jgi:hypothetical protein
MNPVMLALVIVVIALVVAHQLAMRHISSRAQMLYASNKPDEMLAYLDSGFVQRLMPNYNINYMRLNAYELKGDRASADQTIDLLYNLSADGRQRVDLISTAFRHYLTVGDKAGAKKVLGWTNETLSAKPLAKEFDKLYAITFEGSDDYIDEMKGQIPKADIPTKERLLYLLAKQYDNQGDEQSAAQAREELKKLHDTWDKVTARD